MKAAITQAIRSFEAGHDVEVLDAYSRTTLSQAIKSEGPMASFEANGFKLAGAEYWPYTAGEDARYPEDVMWGFYPKKGVVPTVAPDAPPDGPDAGAPEDPPDEPESDGSGRHGGATEK